MLFYSGKFGPHPIIANANTATRWAAYLFAITAALLLARHVRRLMFPRSRALAMLLVACTSLSLLANVVQLILSMFTWGLSKAPIFPFMHTFWTYAALRLLGLSFAAATLLVLLSIARDARAPRLLIALGVCLAIRVLLLLAYLTASGIITALMTGVMPSPFAAAVDPSMWTLNVVPWCESSAPLVVGVATLLLARTIRHLPPISAP